MADVIYINGPAARIAWRKGDMAKEWFVMVQNVNQFVLKDTDGELEISIFYTKLQAKKAASRLGKTLGLPVAEEK